MIPPTAIRTAATALLLLGVLMLASACRGPRPLTVAPEEIAAHGTATFEGSQEAVFRACVEALTTSGYTIAREDAARGLIETERLQARTPAVSRDGRRFLRRYELAVRSAAGAGVEVVARPLLAEARGGARATTNESERGAETVWTLEEERAEWRRVIEAVKRALRCPPGAPCKPLKWRADPAVSPR